MLQKLEKVEIETFSKFDTILIATSLLIFLLRPGRMRAREMRACSRDEWLVILTFHLPCVALRGRKDDCLQSRHNTGFPGTHVMLQYYESFS